MVICFTSYRSLGCTFLDWSFNWLSGHENYWFNEKNKWDKLVENPLSHSGDGNPYVSVPPFENAHKHKTNHPIGIEEWVKITKKLNEMSFETQPLTYYGSTIDIENEEKYFDCIFKVLELGAMVIFLRCDDTRPKLQRRYDPSMMEPRKIRDQIMKEKILSKFTTVKDLEEKVGTIPKMREFLSMNIKYFTNQFYKKL